MFFANAILYATDVSENGSKAKSNNSEEISKNSSKNWEIYKGCILSFTGQFGWFLL